MGKAKVPLIVLTDSENDAVCVREHHIVCQDQIVFGAEDIEKSLQIDIFLKEMRKVRCMLVIQAGRSKGMMSVKVCVEGLPEQTITIKVH